MLKKEKQEIILKRHDLETAWLRVAVRYRFLGVYMVPQYQQFIAAHSELPFLLQRIDEQAQLVQHRELTQERVVHGGMDGDFRTLIISKLCDDPKYEERLAQMRERFYIGNCAEWRETFKKLEDILPYIEPKYEYPVSQS